MSKEAIKTLVPESVYTDRQEFLDYIYSYALKAITRRAMSTVLVIRSQRHNIYWSTAQI